MYEIEFSASVEKDMKKIRIYDRRTILDAIEKQLAHEPSLETKNRRLLAGLIPSFESVLPIWELRVGDFRVFYDVDRDVRKVYVRAMRKKPPHRTTDQIL